MATPAGHLPTGELRRRLYTWTLTSSCYSLYKGLPEKLGEWLLIVERACRASGVPPTQRTEAALLLIIGELAEVMQTRQQTYIERTKEAFWPWTDFKQDIRKIVGADKRGSLKFWLVSAGVALAVAGAFVLVPAVSVLVLNAMGFTAGGVAAGSLAAAIQSIFYGGFTTGIFSILQSLGATMVLPAAAELILGGLATGAGLSILRRALGRGSK